MRKNKTSEQKLFVLFALVVVLATLVFSSYIGKFLYTSALHFSADKHIYSETVVEMYIFFLVTIMVMFATAYVYRYTNIFSLQPHALLVYVFLLLYGFSLAVYLTRNFFYTYQIINPLSILTMTTIISAGILTLHKSARFTSRARALMTIIGTGFIYLGIDEFFEIHEYLGNVLLYPLLTSTSFGSSLVSLFNNADDLILFSYFLIAIMVLIIFWNSWLAIFKKQPVPRVLFITSLVLFVMQMSAEYFNLFLLEELTELYATTSALLSFYLLKK